MKKISTNGISFVKQESDRLEKILKEGKINQKKKEELSNRSNILKSFVTKPEKNELWWKWILYLYAGVFLICCAYISRSLKVTKCYKICHKGWSLIFFCINIFYTWWTAGRLIKCGVSIKCWKKKICPRKR